MAPILAGVLIILLVYAASLADEITKWIATFPEKLTLETMKRAAALIVKVVAKELADFALDKLIAFLKKVLGKQLDKLEGNQSSLAQVSVVIIKSLMQIFESSIGDKINDKLSDLIGDKINVTMNWAKFVKDCLDPGRLMKVSFLLLLCFATFILNFQSARKDAIKNEKKDEEKR